MRLAWSIAIVIACKGSPAPGVIRDLQDGVTFEDVTIRFDNDETELELAIRGKDGTIAHSLEGIERQTIRGELDSGKSSRDPAATRPTVYCYGDVLSEEIKLDPTTKRARMRSRMSVGSDVGGGSDCKRVFLEKGVKSVFVNFFIEGHETEVEAKKIDLADDRQANIPELDAEIERLEAAIKAVDPTKAYAPCARANLEIKHDGKRDIAPCDAGDLRTLAHGDTTWSWLSTDLFSFVRRYKLRRHTAPQALLQDMKENPHVLVYVARTSRMPVAGLDGKFTAGVYDGRAIVVDRATGGRTPDSAGAPPRAAPLPLPGGTRARPRPHQT